MATEAKIRANTKYVKKTYQRFELKLRKDSEQHLIEHLNKQPSKNDYIKQLIIKDYQNK